MAQEDRISAALADVISDFDPEQLRIILGKAQGIDIERETARFVATVGGGTRTMFAFEKWLSRAAQPPDLRGPEARSTEEWRAAVARCTKLVPEQHPQLAAAAALSLKGTGTRVTAGAIRKRLADQGRDAESAIVRGDDDE